MSNTVPHPPHKPHKSPKAWLPEAWLWLLFLAAVAALLKWVAAPAVVSGESMQPTLQTGNVLLLEKYPRFFSATFPTRGDIVVFRGPPSSPYAWETRQILGLEYKTRPAHIKRVLAVAGDRVNIAGGQVWVNGAALPIPAAQGGYLDDLAPQTVPPGYVWVMGDNHLIGASLDSRTYGPVRTEDILGRVRWQLWPKLKRVE